MMAYILLIIGGLLEPLWVISLKKSENFKIPLYTVLFIVLMLLSPLCLGLAMNDIAVGTAYAVWTGIGSVGAVIAGMILYKEKMDRIRIICLIMIVAGVIGLALTEGTS